MNIIQKLAELELKEAENPIVADTSKRVQEQYKTALSALKKVRISIVIIYMNEKERSQWRAEALFEWGCWARKLPKGYQMSLNYR